MAKAHGGLGFSGFAESDFLGCFRLGGGSGQFCGGGYLGSFVGRFCFGAGSRYFVSFRVISCCSGYSCFLGGFGLGGGTEFRLVGGGRFGGGPELGLFGSFGLGIG